MDTIKVENGRLIMDVALDAQGKPSASGKTVVYFSTRGNQKVNDGYIIGVNLYKYKN